MHQLVLLILYAKAAVCITPEIIDLLTPQKTYNEGCGYANCPVAAAGTGGINVHIVPYTHFELGDTRNFYQHYTGAEPNNTLKLEINMKKTYDYIVTEMSKHDDIRFAISDMAYFFEWWRHRDYTVRRIVYMLLREGRLSFVGGNWGQSDEAITSYHAIIESFTYTLRKINATFLDCGRPLVAWQADVKGHSREFASLVAQMGFDGLFIHPISFDDELARMRRMALEMLWRGSDDLGAKSDIFTHVLFDGYWSPPGFCFGSECTDPRIVTSSATFGNAKQRAEDFVEMIYNRQSTSYNSSHVLVMMGQRDGYWDAPFWFRNIEALMHEVNIMPRRGHRPHVHMMYSSPHCYLQEVYKEGPPPLEPKQDDFFPIALNPNTFFIGHYTSFPSMKLLLREGLVFLQMAKQLQVLGQLDPSNKSTSILEEFMWILGAYQDHTIASGASVYFVKSYYDYKMFEMITKSISTLRMVFNNFRKTPSHVVYYRCTFNESVCYVAQGRTYYLHIYNPLAWKVRMPVRFPIQHQGGKFTVHDPKGKLVPSSLIRIPDFVLKLRAHPTDYEVVFIAEIPPLGYRSYFLERTIEPRMKRSLLPKETSFSSATNMTAKFQNLLTSIRNSTITMREFNKNMANTSKIKLIKGDSETERQPYAKYDVDPTSTAKYDYDLPSEMADILSPLSKQVYARFVLNDGNTKNHISNGAPQEEFDITEIEFKTDQNRSTNVLIYNHFVVNHTESVTEAGDGHLDIIKLLNDTIIKPATKKSISVKLETLLEIPITETTTIAKEDPITPIDIPETASLKKPHTKMIDFIHANKIYKKEITNTAAVDSQFATLSDEDAVTKYGYTHIDNKFNSSTSEAEPKITFNSSQTVKPLTERPKINLTSVGIISRMYRAYDLEDDVYDEISSYDKNMNLKPATEKIVDILYSDLGTTKRFMETWQPLDSHFVTQFNSSVGVNHSSVFNNKEEDYMISDYTPNPTTLQPATEKTTKPNDTLQTNTTEKHSNYAIRAEINGESPYDYDNMYKEGDQTAVVTEESEGNADIHTVDIDNMIEQNTSSQPDLGLTKYDEPVSSHPTNRSDVTRRTVFEISTVEPTRKNVDYNATQSDEATTATVENLKLLNESLPANTSTVHPANKNSGTYLGSRKRIDNYENINKTNAEYSKKFLNIIHGTIHPHDVIDVITESGVSIKTINPSLTTKKCISKGCQNTVSTVTTPITASPATTTLTTASPVTTTPTTTTTTQVVTTTTETEPTDSTTTFRRIETTDAPNYRRFGKPIKKKKKPRQDLYIENDYIRIDIDADSHKVSSVTLSNGITTPLDLQFYYYVSDDPDVLRTMKVRPGSFVFRPMDPKPIPILDFMSIKIIKSSIVEEAHFEYSNWTALVVRLYEESPVIEVNWALAPIPVMDGMGKEVFIRYQTNIKNNGVFYTDSNGRQTMKRVRNTRPMFESLNKDPISGNFYPINSKIYIEDLQENVRFSVFPDRAEAGASLYDGEIDLMLARRLMTDDYHEPGHFFADQYNWVRGKHYLYLTKANYYPNKIFEKKFAKEIELAPQLFVSERNPYPNRRQWMIFDNELSLLQIKLPIGIHILTIEPWNADTLLLRLENYLEKSDTKKSGTKTVFIQQLFTTIIIYRAEETTLGANIWLKDLKPLHWLKKDKFIRSFNEFYSSNLKPEYQEDEESNPFEPVNIDNGITLQPQEIRTFVCWFDLIDLDAVTENSTLDTDIYEE